MASGGGSGRGTEYIDKLRENLTCPLCLDTYDHEEKAPKVIPCQHSFCTSCLEGLLRANRGYTVPCPVCRESFRVPPASRHNAAANLAAFPTNLALKNLVDVLREEEEVAAKASRRLCAKHVRNEVIMVCRSCRVDVCAMCIKTGGHYDHALEDLQTAYEEVANEIDKVLIPELKDMMDRYDMNVKGAQDELADWKALQFDIIEGRTVALIAQVCAWRDRNKASIQAIYESVSENLREECHQEDIEPIKDEIQTRQPVSFSRLAELENLKAELSEILQRDLQVIIPEVRLSDHVGIHLPDMITVEQCTVASPIEPASALKLELVASLSLVEQNWLDSHPLHVYDSAGGTNNDVLLVTDTSLLKYELINCHFRQVWTKPLPKLTKGANKTAASLYRAFVTPRDANIVLRAYPSTARFNPYLATDATAPQASVYLGDYGQLVGVGDDRLLYWNRPVVTVYRLPGHQLLCELAAAGGDGNQHWTWVAACVHPVSSEMAVMDWGTKTVMIFSADGQLLSSTNLSYTPAPYKSSAIHQHLLAVAEYAGRGLRLHQWLPTDRGVAPNVGPETLKYLGKVSTRQMGLAEGEEITCCLGWGEDDTREGRKDSVGVLTLLVNGNGTKRLVAYRVMLKETVEEEEQEATLQLA